MSQCLPIHRLRALAALPAASTPPDDEEHVSECTKCRGLLASLEADGELREPTLADDVVNPGPTELPSIPGLHIVRELHRGGQGVVYEAEQLDPARPVAVKLMLAGAFATDAERRRFEREIDLVSALDHPGIIKLHGTGQTEAGRHVVMQLVRGRDLDEWLKEGPSLRDRLRLFIQVCEAVAHAHRRGVIHRDLKPANVRVDAEGRPIVLDFGLAKPIGDDARLTLTGFFAGTLAYASPEQVSGDPRNVDTRTDVHALSAILYEMLAGAPPFGRTTDLAAALSAVLNVQPPPPSSKQPAVPADLDAICLHGLAKRPEDRYSSVDALREDVERFLAGDAVQARRSNRWYVLRRIARRHRLALGVLLSLTAIGGISVAMILRERDVALEAQAEAETRLRAANAVTDFMMEVFGATHDGGRELTGREMLGVIADRAPAAFDDDPEVKADLLRRLASVHSRTGMHDRALELATDALRIHESLSGDQRVDVADDHEELGRITYRLGHADRAVEHFRRALEIHRQVAPDDRRRIGDLLNSLGASLARIEPAEARRALSEAVDLLATETDDEYSWRRRQMALSNLAGLRWESGDHAGAEEAYQEVYDVWEARGDSPEALATISGFMAQCRYDRGDHVGAEAFQRRSVRLFQDYYQQEDDILSAAIGYLGVFVEAQGRFEEARELFLDAHGGLQDSEGPEPLRTLESLARVDRSLGTLDVARCWHVESIGRHRDSFGETDPRLGRALLNAAQTDAAAGDDAEATWRARVGLALLRGGGQRYEIHAEEAETLLLQLNR